MSESVTIRQALFEELTLLASIERDAQQRYRGVGYDYCADGPVRDRNEHERAFRDGAVIIAETGSEAVGFLMLCPADGRAHIVEVAVRCAFQGRGIGRALFAAAETWARASGFDELTLTTYLEVPWNAPLYRMLGFEDFKPGDERPELKAIQAHDATSGFARWPRCAMKKALGRSKGAQLP